MILECYTKENWCHSCILHQNHVAGCQQISPSAFSSWHGSEQEAQTQLQTICILNRMQTARDWMEHISFDRIFKCPVQVLETAQQQSKNYKTARSAEQTPQKFMNLCMMVLMSCDHLYC